MSEYLNWIYGIYYYLINNSFKGDTIMKSIILPICFLLFQMTGIVRALDQDLQVYPDNNTFIVRGQLDNEVLKTFTDASKAIQFAINEIPDGGGEVLLQRGNYRLVRPVYLKSNVWLHGKGRGTLLQVTAGNEEGAGIILKGLKGSFISDLAVKPVEPQMAEAGIIIDDCGDCKVSNIFCQGFSKYGIWMRNNSFLCEVTGCQLADNGQANIFCQKLAEGGRGGDFVPNLINNCVIYGGGHGIECERTIVLNIIGCLVFQAKGYGYYLRASSNSVLISGCRTFQIEKHAIVVESTHEANISSNIFCWHRGHGIVFAESAWATVTGNNIIDTGVRTRDGSEMTGIVVKDSCRGIQVTGNNIFNWGDQVPMLNGIEEDKSCYNNQFVSNNINYYTGSDIISEGNGSLVEDNVTSGPKAFVSDGKPPYPDFTMERLEKFMNE
jgi:hypothetical protein